MSLQGVHSVVIKVQTVSRKALVLCVCLSLSLSLQFKGGREYLCPSSLSLQCMGGGGVPVSIPPLSLALLISFSLSSVREAGNTYVHTLSLFLALSISLFLSLSSKFVGGGGVPVSLSLIHI